MVVGGLSNICCLRQACAPAAFGQLQYGNVAVFFHSTFAQHQPHGCIALGQAVDPAQNEHIAQAGWQPIHFGAQTPQLGAAIGNVIGQWLVARNFFQQLACDLFKAYDFFALRRVCDDRPRSLSQIAARSVNMADIRRFEKAQEAALHDIVDLLRADPILVR